MANEIKQVSGVPQSTTYGTPGAEQIVDATFGAARVSLKPNDYMGVGVIGGHYMLSAQSGALTGVAAAGPVFSFRWAPGQGAPPYALIKKVQIAAVITTGFTAAQAVDFDLVLARSFTSSDTGGSALTPFTGNSQKMRAGLMSTSALTDCRIATTAALAAGTRTLDSSALTSAPIVFPLTTATSGLGEGGGDAVDLFKEDAVAQHPLMLAVNEGFLIRVVTAMGAAGVIKLYVNVSWAEVPGL